MDRNAVRHRSVIVAASVAAVAIVTAGAAWAGVRQWSNGFEGNEARSWWTAGHAGIDIGKGLAHTGANNGWARNPTGWNAVNTWVTTERGATCTVGAWIRSSDTLTDGYMSIRSARTGLPILNEVKIVGAGAPNPAHANYNFYSFQFRADGPEVLFYVGLWGNGRDSWIQVDDVTVTCPTPF